MRLERARERLGGKLRPLVRVEDLWGAVADNGLFHRFDAKGYAHRVRESVGEHLDLIVALVRGTVAAASGESFFGALHKLLLPGLYLVRVHLEALGELRQRAVAANGGEGYLRLERRTMGSACAS